MSDSSCDCFPSDCPEERPIGFTAHAEWLIDCEYRFQRVIGIGYGWSLTSQAEADAMALARAKAHAEDLVNCRTTPIGDTLI